MRYAAVALLLCACSGGGGGGGSSGGGTPTPPTPAATGVASAASPYAAGCGGAGGTLFVNAEVEPHLAVDPRNPDHLVGAWQQDRWSNGSARGIVTAASFDGGATWTRAQPAFTTCAGGEFVRATDPWVTFSPDGTVFVAALGNTGGTFGQGSSNAVAVVRSIDGGRTWSAPVTLVRDGAAAFNDKDTITADPNDARFVYAVWDRLVQGGGAPSTFARSTDGGLTWEAAKAIYDPGPGAQTISNLVQVLPNGTLVNVFLELQGAEDQPTSAAVRLVRSTDRGVTWSAPITISSQHALGARDPASGRPVRDGSIVPQAAVSADGTLHVAWQDNRFSGVVDGIAYTRSTDGGLTWIPAVRVNGAPAVWAFSPQIHVRADGMVGVSYFDLRSDTADAPLLTDYWLARSTDGVTWSDTRIAPTFDLGGAPPTDGGLFLGDYMGLASSGGTFFALYARPTGDPANRTDIVLARVNP